MVTEPKGLVVGMGKYWETTIILQKVHIGLMPKYGQRHNPISHFLGDIGGHTESLRRHTNFRGSARLYRRH